MGIREQSSVVSRSGDGGLSRGRLGFTSCLDVGWSGMGGMAVAVGVVVVVVVVAVRCSLTLSRNADGAGLGLRGWEIDVGEKRRLL